jgi:hypothetical protein
MVLKEFFNAKKEKLDDFESPDAFEKEDCLSCRVLGPCSQAYSILNLAQLVAHFS